jgi:hypothetical protein
MPVRKPSPRDTAPINLPERPPKLPQDVLARFPSLVEWERQWAEMWEIVKGNIRARDAELEHRLADLENP